MVQTVGFVLGNCESLAFFFGVVSLRSSLVLVLVPSDLVPCLVVLMHCSRRGASVLVLPDRLVLCRLIFF